MSTHTTHRAAKSVAKPVASEKASRSEKISFRAGPLLWEAAETYAQMKGHDGAGASARHVFTNLLIKEGLLPADYLRHPDRR